MKKLFITGIIFGIVTLFINAILYINWIIDYDVWMTMYMIDVDCILLGIMGCCLIELEKDVRCLVKYYSLKRH